MKKTRYLLPTSAAVIILAIASLVVLDAYGKNRRVYHQAGRLGSSNVETLVVDAPGDAFVAWKERGFTGRILVYVAGAWERLDNIYEPPVSRPYPLRLFRISGILTPADLTSANILYHASLNNVYRKLIVVLPEDALNKVAARARTTKDFRMDGDTLYFPYQGLPRWFMTASDLTKPDEPILLYVSASYFRNGDPGELYQRLSHAGLETDNVMLCREKDAANVTDTERNKLMLFAGLINQKPGSQSH